MSVNLDLEGRVNGSLAELGVPAALSSWLWTCLPVLAVVVGATLGVLVLVWLERKISAAVQQRVGPEYAGALGLVQALADGLKLVLKEDVRPSKGDRWLFTLGPAIVVIPVLLSYLVVPFGHSLVVSDIALGIFVWISISSVAPVGLLVAGYGSNNKYAFLGGLRAAAQSISYEIPLTLCVLCIVLLSHSLSTVQIVEQQVRFGFLGWNVWRQPVGFLVFFLASLAECERLPFDLPEAEEELVAGYQTEYCGMRFGLFYVASYLNLLLSSFFVTVLYFGGWSLNPMAPALEAVPWGFDANTMQVWKAAASIVITLSKCYFFVFVCILTRWTLPRVRMDQLLDLGWKFLLPISLGNLLVTASFQLAIS